MALRAAHDTSNDRTASINFAATQSTSALQFECLKLDRCVQLLAEE